MLQLNDYVEVKISKCVSDYEYSLTLEAIGEYLGNKRYIKEIVKDDIYPRYRLDTIDDMLFYGDELVKMEGK